MELICFFLECFEREEIVLQPPRSLLAVNFGGSEPSERRKVWIIKRVQVSVNYWPPTRGKV